MPDSQMYLLSNMYHLAKPMCHKLVWKILIHLEPHRRRQMLPAAEPAESLTEFHIMLLLLYEYCLLILQLHLLYKQ